MTAPSDELIRARELALSLLREAVTSDNGSHSVSMTVAVPLLLAALQSTAEKARAEEREREPFQSRVHPWMLTCFGEAIAADKLERADRFIEEALELVQATGYSAERARALVDYVFGRPAGEPHQEVGGVKVTLAALCLANGLDMDKAAEDELARVWTKVDVIRAKQAAKPTGSALPVAAIMAEKETGQ